MTDRLIDRVEKTIGSLEQLHSSASTPVERVDIADIASDLKKALEKLQVLQEYQMSSSTDYNALWEKRKLEIKEFERSRNAWLRTEIITNLLCNNN